MNECPNCHAKYSFDTECLNQEWFDNSYYDYCHGTCECCGKTYKWTEKYQFVEILDIEELTDS